MSDRYFVSKGGHQTADDGRCAMEWVSYLAGEPHSDHPQCVSPVLTAFCIAFNDVLPDAKRQRLRPFLARTIGTRGDGLDEQRSWLATDWLIRTYTPTWLVLAGLDAAAFRLRELPPVLTAENLSRAMGDLNAARGEAAAAWDAAWAAARAAAWAAARAAAGDAARAAAGDAAWDAAWAAARDAAWDAAGDAARAAAGAAARAAAGDAARDPRDAAWAALAPTVAELQESAFGLLDRMLPLEVVQLPVAVDAEAVVGAER